MGATPWSVRVIVRYGLLQLPALALVGFGLFLVHRWLGLPAPVAWGAALLWAAKDVVLYPFVWRAYDPGGDGSSLVGEEGVAEEALSPSGYVRLGAELWRAELVDPARPVPRGGRVRVRRVEGLTVLVEPADEVGPT